MSSNTHDVPFHARHEDELLTLDEVAEILQTSPNTVRWWRQTGTGPEFLQDRPAALHDGRRPAPLHPRAAPHRPTGHRSAQGGVRAMEGQRHVFLHASEVMARYGWGKTKGYQNLKDRELVPVPVMTQPDHWRLDQLLACEERRMAEAAMHALVAPEREQVTVTDLLPQPKRRHRSA